MYAVLTSEVMKAQSLSMIDQPNLLPFKFSLTATIAMFCVHHLFNFSTQVIRKAGDIMVLER